MPKEPTEAQRRMIWTPDDLLFLRTVAKPPPELPYLERRRLAHARSFQRWRKELVARWGAELPKDRPRVDDPDDLMDVTDYADADDLRRLAEIEREEFDRVGL